MGETSSPPTGRTSVPATWPELGPLSIGTGIGFPAGLIQEIEEFVRLSQRLYRLNSRADTALNVLGIVLSVAIVAAGVHGRSDISTILGALVAATVTAQRAFPFQQRWQFYRTLWSQAENLATRARTGAIKPEEALVTLGSLRLDFAQQIPRGNQAAPEAKLKDPAPNPEP
jgi:hypothetical protein